MDDQPPVADDIFSRYPGAFAWAFGIATGVAFIGLLYRSAGH
ncbi:MAG: hypothetical protein VX265_10620 [Myxococcota bacterium]|nr:hypothetical protein [Myxococcota bacterium]MEC8422461.1 hypothetical protein [Myxococcota bacterium]